ncbi:MAG: hypothetical protein C0486_14370 [Erythrobacter sp.]|nr:hypothetical protein [Erythrobacter sp.]MBA4081206.1 hypothetical protein [Erythrobacter sp.]
MISKPSGLAGGSTGAVLAGSAGAARAAAFSASSSSSHSRSRSEIGSPFSAAMSRRRWAR